MSTPSTETPDSSSYIYFIQAGVSGPVKIGVSNDPFSRLRQLQTGNVENLRILAIHPGDLELEKALHRYFQPHRLKNEWFEPCEELLDLVDRPDSLSLWAA